MNDAAIQEAAIQEAAIAEETIAEAWTTQGPPGDSFSLLNDAEAETLLLMLGYGHGEDGFTKEDFDALMDWAQMARMNEGLLQNVLAGDLSVRVNDGEVAFRATAKGVRAVEAMIQNTQEQNTQEQKP